MTRPIQQPSQPSQTQAPFTADRADVHALEMKRSELKSQLQSLTERRMLINMQMRDARGTSTERDLERALKEMDARTARIDAELNRVDDAITQALDRDITAGGPMVIGPGGPALAPGGETRIIQVPQPFPFGRDFGNTMRTFMVFEGVQIALLALIAWRWLRSRAPVGTARLAPEDATRIDQLQRAVDVIAVEVERISENQRFVSKVLGANAAQEANAPVREKESTR